MFDTQYLLSARDTVLATIPFVVLLVMCMFRLDEILAAPRGGRPVPPRRQPRARVESVSSQEVSASANGQVCPG